MSDDHFGRALQTEGDHVLRPDTLCDESPGELVSARVELRVGQFSIPENQRDVFRCLGDLPLEVVDEGGLRDWSRGVVEVVEELASLMGREDLQAV